MLRRIVLALVAGLALLGFLAPSASAADNHAKNSSSSKSVIYVRPCLTYSDPACAYKTIYPGQKFPSWARYAKVGFGWQACKVGQSYICFEDDYTYINGVALRWATWYVS